jgi:hypothetical protein
MPTEGKKMHTTQEWLEMCRKELGAGDPEKISFYRLAIVLGITRQMMSRLKLGKDCLSDEMAIEVARILTIPPAHVVFSAHAEKAEKARRLEVSKFWSTAAQKAGRKAATIAAVAIGVGVLLAGQGAFDITGGITHYLQQVADSGQEITIMRTAMAWTMLAKSVLCAAALAWLLRICSARSR